MKRHLPALAGEFTCHHEETQKRSKNYFISSFPEKPPGMRSLLPGHLPPPATHQHRQQAGQSPGQGFKGKMETSHYSQAHHCSRARRNSHRRVRIAAKERLCGHSAQMEPETFGLLNRALGESLVEAYPHGWSHTDCNKEPVT